MHIRILTQPMPAVSCKSIIQLCTLHYFGSHVFVLCSVRTNIEIIIILFIVLVPHSHYNVSNTSLWLQVLISVFLSYSVEATGWGGAAGGEIDGWVLAGHPSDAIFDKFPECNTAPPLGKSTV